MLETAWIALGLTLTPGSAPDPPASAEFKLVVALNGPDPEPLDVAEMVAIDGRVFRYSAESPEILVYDPKAERLDLIDLRRKMRTRVTAKELDAATAALRKAIAARVAELEAEGGKANEVAARMSRDLIDPSPAATYDPKARRLRLANRSVEIDAVGVPEPDAARRALLAGALAAVSKLAAMRDPRVVPPFAQLAALGDLSDRRGLRPTEMTCRYRLAGPPLKVRWTYHFTPAPTDRDREAIRRLDRFQAAVPLVVFEDYERRTAGARRDAPGPGR